jgi:hypothetical protein
MMEGITHDDRYRVVDDIIYYKDMIYLVLESTLKDKILRVVHDELLVGHLGYLNTYRKVRECMTCQWNKSELMHPASLFQPLPIP